MNAAWIIARRELGGYLKTPMGYIVAALALALFGFLTAAFAFGSFSGAALLSNEVMRQFFYYNAGLVIVVSMVLPMRAFAEERQTGTMILLDTAPVREWQIVLGKFLGVYLMVAIITLASIYMPLWIGYHGKLSLGHMFAGYVGLLMLAAATASIGTFASALSRTQLIAIVLSIVLLCAFILPGFAFTVAGGDIARPPLRDILAYMDLYIEHGSAFSRGVLRTTDFIYYGTLSFVFLLATTKVLATRRWAG